MTGETLGDFLAPVNAGLNSISALLLVAGFVYIRRGEKRKHKMAMLGAVLARKPILEMATLEQALIDHLPARKAHLLGSNLQVLRRGFEVGDTIPA